MLKLYILDIIFKKVFYSGLVIHCLHVTRGDFKCICSSEVNLWISSFSDFFIKKSSFLKATLTTFVRRTWYKLLSLNKNKFTSSDPQFSGPQPLHTILLQMHRLYFFQEFRNFMNLEVGWQKLRLISVSCVFWQNNQCHRYGSWLESQDVLRKDG